MTAGQLGPQARWPRCCATRSGRTSCRRVKVRRPSCTRVRFGNIATATRRDRRSPRVAESRLPRDRSRVRLRPRRREILHLKCACRASNRTLRCSRRPCPASAHSGIDRARPRPRRCRGRHREPSPPRRDPARVRRSRGGGHQSLPGRRRRRAGVGDQRGRRCRRGVGRRELGLRTRRRWMRRTRRCRRKRLRRPGRGAPPVPTDDSTEEKVQALATKVYGASDVAWDTAAHRALERVRDAGFGHLPVCVAKTHLSLSHDPTLNGTPSGFTMPVRDVRLAAGAGFLTVYAGDVMTMPGLPSKPRLRGIDVDARDASPGSSEGRTQPTRLLAVSRGVRRRRWSRGRDLDHASSRRTDRRGRA